MQASYGPVNIEGMGIIIVPGSSDAERVAYAQNLYNNFGVFIPAAGTCTEIVTNDRSFPGNPIIALGTLQNYKCFDALNLSELVLFDPIFFFLAGHRADLLAFESLILPYYENMYRGYIPPRAWLDRVNVISIWIDMETYIRQLPYETIQQIMNLLHSIRDRASYICTNDPNKMNDDPQYRNDYNALVSIIPNLVIASPDYMYFSHAYQGIPDWCELYNDVNLLIRKFELIIYTENV